MEKSCEKIWRETKLFVILQRKTKYKQTKLNEDKTMKRTKAIKEVTRERAIEIAANHNNVSKEVATRYTNSELQEVLRQVAPSHLTLKLKM